MTKTGTDDNSVGDDHKNRSPYAYRTEPALIRADVLNLPRWRRMAQWLGVDTAIGFAVLARFWQLFTGPVTQFLIIFCLSATEQGYYYAFLNLLAMQVFVELGLHVVIINVASHEWRGLQLSQDGIVGDLDQISRLISLGRSSFRWYLAAAVCFTVAVSVCGVAFFRQLENGTHGTLSVGHWMSPWLLLVVLTGLQLLLLPLTAILEGCDQLPVINRVRFWQNVSGSLAVWITLTFGLGLWALCASSAIRLCGEFYLVMVRYRSFFAVFRRKPQDSVLDWTREILPLQWRIAVQGALLWFSSHLAGLVILTYHGPPEAGRFGMLWTVLTALQSASFAWVETRRPLFGRLIADQNYGELDERFFRAAKMSVLLLVTGVISVIVAVWFVGSVSHPVCARIANRLPDVKATAVFGLAFAALHPALCTNVYVRAHKKDPFLIPAIVSNLAVGGLVYLLGRQFGIIGCATGYLAGVAVVQTPIWVTVWLVTRRKWHDVGDVAEVADSE